MKAFRRWALHSFFLFLGIFLAAPPLSAQDRPNILFAMADDWSWPHAGVYGDPTVSTPNFDRVASQGVLFTNAFCAAPQCSPNRASILTGRCIWQNEEAGTHASLFPAKFKVYPEILAGAGYKIGYTGKPWGPGNWKESGRPRNPAGPEYNSHRIETPPTGVHSTDYAKNFESFLDECPPGQPFCFWFGCKEPHRKYEEGIGKKHGIDPNRVRVPPFLPDHPIIRGDIADYAFEVQWFDDHLGKMLDLLESRGLLENTLVVVTSDNGMPFPRAKANLYEYGVHMPLAVMWPERVPPGRRVDDLISFIDFAPTFLEAAGLPSEPAMTGKSFLPILTSGKQGWIDTTRKFVVGGRERHTHARPDNRGYPARFIRTRDYLFVWNLNPDLWPAGDDLGEEGFYDIDASPSKSFLLDRREDPEMKKFFDWAVARRPEFELFDIREDPACLTNLASDPGQQGILDELHTRLESILISQKDPRLTGQWDLFDSYPRVSRMRPFLGGFSERGKYNPAFQKRDGFFTE